MLRKGGIHMNESEEKQSGSSCGCGTGGSCGKTKWIWVALTLALGVVVLGKLANKESSSCCIGGLCPLPPVAVASNTVPRAAVAPVAVKLPRLVDLGAGKCIPCKMMAPILEELKKTYAGKLDVQFIDVWVNPDEGPKYGIKIIPTQIFYDASGKELFRHEGFLAQEDILAKWKEFGVDLVSPVTNKASAGVKK